MIPVHYTELTEEERLRLQQERPTGIDFLFAWMTTKNPMLGGVTPLWMMEHGRGDKLAKFIRAALKENKP